MPGAMTTTNWTRSDAGTGQFCERRLAIPADGRAAAVIRRRMAIWGDLR